MLNLNLSIRIIGLIVVCMVVVIHLSKQTNEDKIKSYMVTAGIAVVLMLASFSYLPSDSIDPYMNVGGVFLKGNPKVDGCCLFPEQEICKQYSSEELESGCCGKGFNGRKVRFQSDAAPSGCRKCRRQGEIL